ncbi:hypothetical protein MCOR25_000246 [Pyricularia grisea]|uniref:Tyrosinase copper-binding domain-containing protein n=1 Tax=Pyricularia grisea TaxID=148305 RepID=A0A6P8BKM3_PYRGI|nr:uncharacterized protein PgNI_02259 [Pyricularia grisea]KAI6383326.1 hypothetical protein MCOR25_000246 [Pyricularia grisea]TLD17215.1 hypothetical protein PgNI_02259 [Pyricularia grisea]
MRISHVVIGSAAVTTAIPWGPSPWGSDASKEFSLDRLIDLTPFDVNRFKLKSPQDLLAQFDSTSRVPAPVADKTKAPRPIVAPSPSRNDTGASSAKVGHNTAAGGPCTQPAVRPEWRNMTAEGRREYVRAAKCLVDRPSEGRFQGSHNRYEDLVWVHHQMTDQLHGYAQFLPWHRRFVNVYETALRDECGYRGPMPWWDETRDAGNFAGAPVFTPEYFGTAPIRTREGRGGCITDGVFSGMLVHIGPGTAFEEHCLSRAVDESLTREVSQATINQVLRQSNFESFAGLIEGWPHAYGHNGVGAVMSDVGPAPGDPIFFLHHAFIDRIWWEWQNVDRDTRVYELAGKVNDRNKRITLDYVLTMRGIQPDVRVQDVMDTYGDTLCYTYDY